MTKQVGARLRYAAVEIVGVYTLTGYDRNARTHSDAQVTQLAAAIDRFGFTQPKLSEDPHLGACLSARPMPE